MAVLNKMYINMLAQNALTSEAAFDELYNFFYPRVYNFIYARVKNIADADDVASMTFMKMNEHLEEFNAEKAAFSTWLFRIAQNTLIDFVRRKNRLNEAQWEEFAEAKSDREEPEERMIRKEGNAELLKALDTLNERERRVIELKYWSDMDNEEIAEVLNITNANVRVILHRTLKKLETIIKPN